MLLEPRCNSGSRRPPSGSLCRIVGGLAVAALVFLPKGSSIASGKSERLPGWGIDACLSCHIDWGEVPGYIELLKSSQIVWLRERGFGQTSTPEELPEWAVDPWDTHHRRVWREARSAGFRVVAFAGTPEPVPVEHPSNQLPEDLRKVYRQSYLLGHLTLGEVDAFELVGEPDAHYCKDLPDRVAAFQKAAYLGIKDGALAAHLGDARAPETTPSLVPLDRLSHPRQKRASTFESPIILSGGLAFPPGNWLDLAAENGIYEYTDAVNFHHYGFASDLAPAIRAHREFGAKWSGRGELPVWITEAGLNNIPPNGWHDPTARRLQAEYLITCAEAALAENVVVFMPFILAHRNDPFAMTERADRTFPAWDAYQAFTHSHRIDPALPLIRPPENPSRVVLQWMPAPERSIPFKVGGTYWFKGESEMTGTLWIYNFDANESEIIVRRDDSNTLLVNGKAEKTEWTVRVPAGDRRGLSLVIPYPETGHQRQTMRFSASVADDSAHTSTARLVFRAGLRPTEALPHKHLVIPFEQNAADLETPELSYISGNVERPKVIELSTVWTGLNGVRAIKAVGETSDPAQITCTGSEDHPGPLHPPMLVARVNGLPGSIDLGAIRLTVRDTNGLTIGTRVDLIDDAGQRFTIIENLGRLRDEPPSPDVWLAYADFHPWVFGHTVAGARFDPNRVREVQLRFYGLNQHPRSLSISIESIEFLESNTASHH